MSINLKKKIFFFLTGKRQLKNIGNMVFRRMENYQPGKTATNYLLIVERITVNTLAEVVNVPLYDPQSPPHTQRKFYHV